MSSLRIIVTGLIAQHPLIGGITWHYLQYLLGLKRLGHDVYYFEDSGEYPYNLDGGASGSDWIATDCTENVSYLNEVMSRFELEDRWAYYTSLRSEWFGLSEMRRKDVIKSTEILINVSGTLEFPEKYREIPVMLYIDTDPIVTQIKIADGNIEFGKRVETHDVHFSFGEALSDNFPLTKYKWQPTRQPIVLSEWKPPRSHRETFTTVMNWTSYPPLSYLGQTYSQKDVEFKRFLELPQMVSPVEMEIALSKTNHKEWQAIDEYLPRKYADFITSDKNITPRDLISYAGWNVVDASEICGNFDSYRKYIESSKAEWSVAKNAYVMGKPGWFSERSACYLAAGRPVVVQDTGFSEILPTGEGILSFKTLSESVDAIQEVVINYQMHARAARAIAETYFDSDKVLMSLIEDGTPR